jgi:hypothetical protein
MNLPLEAQLPHFYDAMVVPNLSEALEEERGFHYRVPYRRSSSRQEVVDWPVQANGSFPSSAADDVVVAFAIAVIVVHCSLEMLAARAGPRRLHVPIASFVKRCSLNE